MKTGADKHHRRTDDDAVFFTSSNRNRHGRNALIAGFCCYHDVQNRPAAQLRAIRRDALDDFQGQGQLHAVNGTVNIDDSDIAKSSVEVTIDASTIDTREPDRDNDLKSPHFLDVTKYPTMTFKSTKVENGAPGHLKITGDLTIHGVTKSVVLDVTAPKSPIKDPWGLQRTAVSGATKINRHDFGLTYSPTLDNGGLVVGNEVEITLDAEMIIPPAK